MGKLVAFSMLAPISDVLMFLPVLIPYKPYKLHWYTSMVEPNLTRAFKCPGSSTSNGGTHRHRT